MGSVDSLK